MGWRDWLTVPPPQPANGHTAALTAAAQVVRSNQGILNRAAQPQRGATWQDEVWGYYDDQGEFGFAVTWKANMISRVRLKAAKVVSGSDEPDIEGAQGSPAADLVDTVFGGIGGKAEAMSTFAVHLNVPGESWLLIEEDKGGIRGATVRSADEVRVVGGKTEVVDETQSGDGRDVWRELGDEGEWMLVRVHRAHKRKRAVADSPARRARAIIRELELVNRHITAQYLSRLASAGIIVFPLGVTFPVREEFRDEPDPFVREWIEVAREAIAEPGSASSIIPIPMQLPPEVIDKIKHIDFTVTLDDSIIAKRESAIRRLALQVDMPPEVLLGMAEANHWGAWQIEEGAVKAHILPDVELIVGALTEGWLWPLLRTMNVVDPEQWVVWYDASEIILRPDHSDNALALFKVGEISGVALRRETGMDESDKPTDEEKEAIILAQIAIDNGDLNALDRLMGRTAESAAELPGAPSEPTEPDQEDEDMPVDGPPDTRQNPPPGPEGTPPDRLRTLDYRQMTQRRTTHYLEVRPEGTWLRHPTLCIGHHRSCPFTTAVNRAVSSTILVTPGQSGFYAAGLAGERIAIGVRSYPSENELLERDPDPVGAPPSPTPV